MRQSGRKCQNLLKTTEKPINNKKTILKIQNFTNDYLVSTIEVLEPMVLSSKIRELCDCRQGSVAQIPQCILDMFDEELVLSGESRRLYVSLGQFSIIRLERDAQLVVPVLDYSIPSKECCDSPGGGEDPCEMFSRIPFPADRFAPRNCDKQDTCCYTTT